MRIPAVVAAILATALLWSVAIAFQGRTPPPFGGDGNPQHDGQPEFCQNTDGGGYVHNCSCQAGSMSDPRCQKGQVDCDPEQDENCVLPESPRCSVYCRPKACRCKKQCEPTTSSSSN